MVKNVNSLRKNSNFFWNKTSGGFFNVVVHATVYQWYRLTSRFQSISYVMREKDSKAQSFHPPGPFPIHRAHGGGKFLIVTLLRPTSQVALSPRAKFREIIGGCPTFRHGFLTRSNIRGVKNFSCKNNIHSCYGNNF